VPLYDVPKAAPGPLRLVQQFVNTADHENGSEWLPDEPALEAWLLEHELAGPVDLAEALELREALRELLRANNGIDVDEAAAATTLDAAARRAGLTVRFDKGAIRLVPAERGVQGALGAVLAAAAEAMADGSWQRLKACRADDCRWASVDHARNHSRQWCDMRVCGNRQKARVFRARHA
jgi:predicted RNA-binding Zn ribbon-like protein